MRSLNHSASLATLVSLQITSALGAQLFIVRHFGAGSTTDAYVASQTIPLLLSSIVTVSLQNVWQPRISQASNAQTARDELGKAQGQALVLLGACTILAWTTMHWWSSVLFPGIPEDEMALVYLLTPILLISSIFNCYASLNVTALRARDRFLFPEVIVACTEVCALAALLHLLPKYGIATVAVVSLSKTILLSLVFHAATGRPSVNFSAGLREKNSLAALLPLLAGSSIYKTSPIVDRYWSSQASSGSMTLFYLAQSSFGAIARVVDRSLCQPETPGIARLWRSRSTSQILQIYRKCILKVAFVAILLAVGLAVGRPLIIAGLSLALTLQEDSASQLWWISLFLTVYVFASSAGSIVVGTFYAIGDTKTPVSLGLISFILGVAIKSACFLIAGIEGLAAGLSIYYLFSLLLSCGALEKKLRSTDFGEYGA